jgi:hypothetical protein
VGTYSQGESIKTYVNAKLDREQETTCILAASEGPLKIGCEPFNGGCRFNGLMDDLRIYNYPLSDAEVAALYEGKEKGMNNYLILVPIIVIIAAAALVIRSKKTKT